MSIPLSLGLPAAAAGPGLLDDLVVSEVPVGAVACTSAPEVHAALRQGRRPYLRTDGGLSAHSISDMFIAVADSAQGDSLSPSLRVAQGCVVGAADAEVALSVLAAFVAVLSGGDSVEGWHNPDLARLSSLSLPAQQAVREVLIHLVMSSPVPEQVHAELRRRIAGQTTIDT